MLHNRRLDRTPRLRPDWQNPCKESWEQWPPHVQSNITVQHISRRLMMLASRSITVPTSSIQVKLARGRRVRETIDRARKPDVIHAGVARRSAMKASRIATIASGAISSARAMVQSRQGVASPTRTATMCHCKLSIPMSRPMDLSATTRCRNTHSHIFRLHPLALHTPIGVV